MKHQRDSNPHFVTPPLSPPVSSPPVSPPRIQPSGRRPKSKRPTSSHGSVNKRQPPDHQFPPAHVTSQPNQPQLPHVPFKDGNHYSPPPEASLHPGPKHTTDQDGQLQQHQEPPHYGDHVQPQEPQLHSAGNRPQQPQQHRGRHHSGQQPHHHRPSSVRVAGSRKARPVAWIIAALCTLFWIIVIVGGLAILIIYLVFRPRLPKFDISSATINAAYLDMGKLNADFTILGNFTNPNKKVNVDFNYVVMDLYHSNALLARRYLEPFTAMKRHSRFVDIHMITSQVPLTLNHIQELRRQMNNGRVIFDIKGLIRARSNLGFLRYSYWLYSHCTITVTGPPTGVMIAKKCTTKR